MKNIHVLPTEKPSRLVIDTIENKLYLQPILHEKTVNVLTQNIYITSDEEDINENDYIITRDGRLVQVSYLLSKDLEGASKVILTTDPDLIKDGVQAIDDNFLEWFVKNPSCEEVKVEDFPMTEKYNSKGEYVHRSYWVYKIIIPKEEPKQETLEEVAEKQHNYASYEAFIRGAKWQQEQDKNKFSEEEVDKILRTFRSVFLPFGQVSDLTLNNWFEQFKNK